MTMWVSRAVSVTLVVTSLAALGGACGGGGGGGGGGAPCDPAAPPKVSGSWILANPEVDSDCPDEITNAFVNALLSGSPQPEECRYQVTQSGTRVTIANRCGGSATFGGCADDDGCVDATWQFSTGPQGCQGTTAADFSSDLSTPLSEADISAPFTFPAGCGIADCEVDVTVSFTKG